MVCAAPRGKLVPADEAAAELAETADGDLKLVDDVLAIDIARMEETRPPLSHPSGNHEKA